MKIEIRTKELGTYILDNGIWWRRPCGQDKNGKPHSRRRATRFQIEIGEILLKHFQNGTLEKGEEEALTHRTSRRKAVARKHLAGKNKGKKMSEEQRAQLSEIAKKRTGEKNPFYGRKHSAETREKIAVAQRARTGWKHTEETKRKMSRAQKGRTFSEETKRKMSKAQRGKILSEETKKKIGDAHRGEKNYWYGKKLPDYIKEAISKANKGRVWTEEERQRVADRMRGTKHTKESREAISKTNAESAVKRTRNYRAFLRAAKAPGNIVPCRGIQEELAVRVFEHDLSVVRLEYESFYFTYADEAGLTRYGVPDFLITMEDGVKKVIEVAHHRNIPRLRKPTRYAALQQYCQENGLQLEVWGIKQLNEQAAALGIKGLLEELGQSDILITASG